MAFKVKWNYSNLKACAFLRNEFVLVILLLLLSSTFPLHERDELTSKQAKIHCNDIPGVPFIIVASNVSIESGMDVLMRSIQSHPCVQIADTIPVFLQMSKSGKGVVGFKAINVDTLSKFLQTFDKLCFKTIFIGRDPLFAGLFYPW